MLSLTPLPLFCALLLCLPLAVIFTINSPRPVPIITLSASDSNFLNTKLSKGTFSPPPPQDDEQLLRLASRANPNPPRGSTRKLAFMFLTTTPLPFAPLWEAFFSRAPKSLYNVYIHADPGYNYDPKFKGVFENRVIHSKPSSRFSPTLVSAARRLLSHALIHDSANYMFALLSPSCVPVHSFNFTYRTVISSPKSFVEVLRNEPGQYDRWSARGDDAMLPEVKLEDFRIGSQFWILTRKHARVVVSDRRVWDKFNKPCVKVEECYPEENYFPTLLFLTDPRGLVPATLTHVDWSVSYEGHPRMYNETEVGPELIREIRETRPRYGEDWMNGSDFSVAERRDPFLFARKFSPETVEVLMSIAKDFILKD